MTWIKITDDKVTLPPVGQVVFVVDADLWPYFLVRELIDNDSNGRVFTWCKPYGLHYDMSKEIWTTYNMDWDDEYNPLYWHELPHPPKYETCQSCRIRLAEERHPCPYREEICDDGETLCNYCDDCRHECLYDI